jgi:hypothetical protein
LEKMGYSVRPVAKSSEERADLIADAPGECVVVEVKSKEVSEIYRQMERRANQGQVEMITRTPTARNRLAGIVRRHLPSSARRQRPTMP